MKKRTRVYVDGFNLYYGLRRFPQYKWLDLMALARLLLPASEISRLHLFTAKVRSRPDDPLQALRQHTYFRALSTVPDLEIVYGHFLSSSVTMMKSDFSAKVRVLKTEEKGSDVNLASHLLIDAYENRYETAAIISNDSDLVYPIRHIKTLGKTAIIINPHAKDSIALRQLTDYRRSIRESDLARCQFPDSLRDEKGEFSRPESWQ